MKIIRFYTLILACLGIITSYAQTCYNNANHSITEIDEYLGQDPPVNTPKKFILETNAGSITTERIAISADGKDIYYGDNSPAGGIKHYKFSDGKWTEPVLLFSNAGGPALSLDEKTMFLWKDGANHFSVKEGDTWGEPIKFGKKLESAHYLQITNSGTFYAGSENANGALGGKDWSKIEVSEKDTVITSLGSPLNNHRENLDFYISKDEEYIVFSSDNHSLPKYGYLDLYISFKIADNSWSTPKNLGKTINVRNESRWGPFVTADNKYLFYSRWRSDTDMCTYWVRFDDLLEELKTEIMSTNNIIETENDILIYPIPTSNTIHVKSDNSYKILSYRIIDLSGKIVKQGLMDSEIINVSALQKGMYMLNLKMKEGVFRKMLIIE